MNIHVRFTDKAIEATAFIKLSEKSSVLRFALSQEMEVQKDPGKWTAGKIPARGQCTASIYKPMCVV